MVWPHAMTCWSSLLKAARHGVDFSRSLGSSWLGFVRLSASHALVTTVAERARQDDVSDLALRISGPEFPSSYVTLVLSS